jgi:hypothetical protein
MPRAARDNDHVSPYLDVSGREQQEAVAAIDLGGGRTDLACRWQRGAPAVSPCLSVRLTLK